MTRLVVWGASGHALVVADIVRVTGNYEIVGFLDSVNTDRHNTEFCGSRILGGIEQLDWLRLSGVTQLIVAFGDCSARMKTAALAKQKGFTLATAIHPRATIAPDAVVGEGTVVAAGAVVNPGARIGSNVVVNTSASIDHECLIADGAHIGPGAHLGGKVTVGAGTWVGIGAVVRDKIAIGANSVIGAGAVVLSDIPAGVVAYGVPARVIRAVEKLNE
jgi:UDP-N-acetylbacillosamine N-acetyltransferase